MRLAWAFQGGGGGAGQPYPVPIKEITAEVDSRVTAEVTVDTVSTNVTEVHPTVSFPDALVVSIDESKVTPDLVADV